MSASRWEEFLEGYYEKIKLEEYQNSRILARPKTTRITVAVNVIILLGVILAGIIGLRQVLRRGLAVRILLIVLYVIAVAESYGRFVTIKAVECYQHYAPDATRRKCKCIPSCSEYAIKCLKKYELIYALHKIRKRLFVTCKGFDYIVDDP